MKITVSQSNIICKILILSFSLFFVLNYNLYSKNKKKDYYDIFKYRRQHLMKLMDGGIAIFPSNIRNEYWQIDKRQEKYFYYLTGIKGETTFCVLDPKSLEPYKLFVLPYSLRKLLWSGKSGGIELAEKKYRADKVYNLYEREKILKDLFKSKKKIFLNTSDLWLTKQVKSLLDKDHKTEIINIKYMIDEMRVIKDIYEQEQIRKAVDITAEALIDAYKFIRPGVWEYQVEAVIEYGFRSRGAKKPAFPTIAGSGPRATTLHYEDNNFQTKNGDLILMDVGAEVNGYSADISRTVPVNGKFSNSQKKIYELVLKAQKEAIKNMGPEKGFNEGHNIASNIIMNGLFKLGLVTDPKSNWQKGLYVLYKSSHYLGLNTHDVGYTVANGKKGRLLKPGMVLTIEPGIYIHPLLFEMLKKGVGKYIKKEELNSFIKKVKPIFEKYKGIGVRIEDDILILNKGIEILSRKVPKEIYEIENLMKKK